jgi:hypothetical protein
VFQEVDPIKKEPMFNTFKTLAVIAFMVLQSSAHAEERYSYSARIQCGNNSGIADVIPPIDQRPQK